MNVLLTSAGRRIALLRSFQAAVAGRGGIVLASDIDALAPALYVADDAVRLPHVLAGDYGQVLTVLARTRKLSLVVPTIDPELPVLAGVRDALAELGCAALVSKPELIRVTGDKVLAAATFARAGFRVAETWRPDDLASARLPDDLFVKPRAGSAGKDTFRVTSAQLPTVLELVPDPVVQAFLDAPEVTIDALLDLEGAPIHYVPRLRRRVLAGESIQGVTIPPDRLASWVESVLHELGRMGARGPMTIQAFLTDGEPTLSEVNPRFGGGVPLALAAGADYPEWILQMLEGRRVEPRLGQYEVGLYMTRYSTELFTRTPRW